MKISIKFPKKKSLNEIKKYFILNNLKIVLKNGDENIFKKDRRFDKNIYKPELNDLYRLHQFIILNKRTTILEFGSGWSSLVISFALKILIKKYKKLDKKKVDIAFLGAWNFKEEIFKKEKNFIKKGGKFITHVPIPQII